MPARPFTGVYVSNCGLLVRAHPAPAHSASSAAISVQFLTLQSGQARLDRPLKLDYGHGPSQHAMKKVWPLAKTGWGSLQMA